MNKNSDNNNISKNPFINNKLSNNELKEIDIVNSNVSNTLVLDLNNNNNNNKSNNIEKNSVLSGNNNQLNIINITKNSTKNMDINNIVVYNHADNNLILNNTLTINNKFLNNQLKNKILDDIKDIKDHDILLKNNKDELNTNKNNLLCNNTKEDTSNHIPLTSFNPNSTERISLKNKLKLINNNNNSIKIHSLNSINNINSKLVLNNNSKCCRICYDDESNEKFIHPCKCEGTMRYIHKKCLKKAIEICSKKSCELCKEEYYFRIKVNKVFNKAKLCLNLQIGLFTWLIWVVVIFLVILIIYFVVVNIALSSKRNSLNNNYSEEELDRQDEYIKGIIINVLSIIGSLSACIIFIIILIRKNYSLLEISNWDVVEKDDYFSQEKFNIKKIVLRKTEIECNRNTRFWNIENNDCSFDIEGNNVNNISYNEQFKEFVLNSTDNVQFILRG